MHFTAIISPRPPHASSNILSTRPNRQGAWAWRLKDWIDRSFMAKFSTELPPMDKAGMRGAPHQVSG